MTIDTHCSIKDAIQKLQQYGFEECTKAANRQNGMDYLYAFERRGDEQHILYCCVTIDDLFALLLFVEETI
jgi:hypothetical protein